MDERRYHERYNAKERSLVTISEDALPYHIIDISMGGLAFRYISREQSVDSVSEINVLYGDEVCLEKVAVESVSDIPFKDGYVPMRRFSIKYRALNAEQKSKLKSFIQTHTHGFAGGTIAP